MDFTVRKADLSDVSVVNEMIHKLAEFENMADLCTLDDETLSGLMSEQNGLSVLIAEADGKVVGITAYHFFKIATFSGKRVLYIEDIFIDEEYRHMGIGSAFFKKCKQIAREENCHRLEWKCLAWNSSARKFYQKTGGLSSDEWLTYTLEI